MLCTNYVHIYIYMITYMKVVDPAHILLAIIKDKNDGISKVLKERAIKRSYGLNNNTYKYNKTENERIIIINTHCC